MDQVEVISALLGLGGQGVLVFFIYQLWLEQKANNDYLREQDRKQRQADNERRELQEKVEALEAYRAASQSKRPPGMHRDN